MPLAVEETVKGAMMSTGQKCTATSRAICVGDAAERFVPLLLKRIEHLKVGDPRDPTTDLGPLVSASQLDRVTSYFDVAEQEQHALAVGGRRLEIEGGYYVAPTVYLDVSPESRLGQEEVFGPLLGVMRAETIGDAVEIANNVRYGLSASLFTRDIGAAFSFVRRIRAGVVHVNSETAGAEPQVPFGGMKDSSSHSREQGDAAVHFYTDVKTVYIDPPTMGEA
jgi:aldehyde dehydrogenase (NAD+)